MTTRCIAWLASAVLLLAPVRQFGKPVNPNATPEAQRLLAFLEEIRGHYTIAAQHNFASSGSKYTDLTKAITGKAPLLWGSDFSFAYKGTEPQKFQHCGPLNLTNPFDPVYYVDATPQVVRQRIVDTAIRLHKSGYLITLMWHAAPPGADDYCDGTDIWTWERRPSQQKWDELTTDGTPLNLAWQKQVDVIAGYLGQLRDAHVPVLWRPYHEMNGKWFWWCDKKGANGFRKLWIMMYDRFVNVHKLDNLIWVWDTNAPRATPGDEAGAYEDFYPGAQYVDVLAADVYHKDWKQSHHDDLAKLAGGKPIALGEVGESPSPDLLDRQPQWAWFMPWFLQVRDPDALKKIYADRRILTLGDVTTEADGTIRVNAQR